MLRFIQQLPVLIIAALLQTSILTAAAEDPPPGLYPVVPHDLRMTVRKDKSTEILLSTPQIRGILIPDPNLRSSVKVQPAASIVIEENEVDNFHQATQKYVGEQVTVTLDGEELKSYRLMEPLWEEVGFSENPNKLKSLAVGQAPDPAFLEAEFRQGVLDRKFERAKSSKNYSDKVAAGGALLYAKRYDDVLTVLEGLPEDRVVTVLRQEAVRGKLATLP